MGTIGVFMSMSANDPAVPGRQAALLAGLANEGVTPANTVIKYGFAFDNNGNGQYQTVGDALVKAANADSPRALFATCWPTMNTMLTSAYNTNNIPIIYGGLFHDDQNVTKSQGPNYFDPSVGGIYSHLFETCAQWVRLLKLAVGGHLKAIGVTYDTTNTNANPNAPDLYINYIKAATGFSINPIKINIDQTVNSTAAVTHLINTNLLFAGSGNTIANSGLIVPPAALTANRRFSIIQAVNALKLPAIYPNRMYIDNAAPNNGLISYGEVLLDQYLIAGLALGNAYNYPASFKSFATHNTNFETVVSRSQAGALNFTIPPGAVVVA